MPSELPARSEPCHPTSPRTPRICPCIRPMPVAVPARPRKANRAVHDASKTRSQTPTTNKTPCPRLVRPRCSHSLSLCRRCPPIAAPRRCRAARRARKHTRAVHPATRSTVASAAVRHATLVASMARSARRASASQTGCRLRARATASCSWVRARTRAAPSRTPWAFSRGGAIGELRMAATCTSRRRSSRRSCTTERSRTSRWTRRAGRTRPMTSTSTFSARSSRGWSGRVRS